MTRTYSTLDPNALGPSLALDLGNLVVTTNGNALSNARRVMGTLPELIGTAYFECQFWSDTQPGTLPAGVAVGICKPDDPLSVAAGLSAGSYAYEPATGDVLNSGATVVSAIASAERKCIGVFVSLSAMSSNVAFVLDGTGIATYTIPSGEAWVPCVTVCGLDAGDVSAFVNFGQRPFLFPPLRAPGSAMYGWYEVYTEGLSTITLALVDEGLTDATAGAVYRPRLLNGEQFSIRRAPMVWPWGSTDGQYAAFGTLEIDNYDGAYDYLLGSDLRDAAIIIKAPAATGLMTGTMMADAVTLATGIVDKISSSREDVITIALKDTAARLDKPLPTRYNPPFADSGAANQMIPLTFGACRNVAPLLIAEANRLYQWHDANIPNVIAVKDKAAPLDPHSTPPQYTPALNGSGLQLQVLPEGKLTGDLSSYGAQAVIPGADDVLNGEGEFATWDGGSPSVPVGWDWSNSVGSSITSSPDYAIQLVTAKVWAPDYSPLRVGDSLSTETAVLEAGKSYRITFKLHSVYAQTYYQFVTGGVMLRMSLDNNAMYAISPHNVPLFVPASYSFAFKVPQGGADCKLYIIVTATKDQSESAYGTCLAQFADVKVELLGQFLELPLTRLPLPQYVQEIVVERGQEPDSVFNSSDLNELDSATLYTYGIHYDAQPNMWSAIRAPLDSFGATMFTDADGVLRTRRFTDPKLGVIKVAFTDANVGDNIQVAVDEASGLTTLIGARRNWSIFSDSDFVTDRDTVPQDTLTRYMRTSQYQRTSSVIPAGQYSFAVGAPVFDSLLDEPDQAQAEIDRVCSIYSPQVYADGTVTNGKRRFVTFTSFYDDVAALGIGTTCPVTELMFGDIITLTYARHGFNATRLLVVAWEIFPFSNKIKITGFY